MDHINRDRLDNRICNLRLATNAENCRNAGKRKDNTSGITGVSYTNGKWRVRVMVNKITLYLGNYKDIELAELVAIEAKNKFHRAFSSSNSDWLDEKVS
ncbi:Fis family transcriptional regulator [Salmonella enterica subsp. diarizonae]|nr:Fis family transcriptional regulator [Salmonella enterica subsp. diarizonae]